MAGRAESFHFWYDGYLQACGNPAMVSVFKSFLPNSAFQEGTPELPFEDLACGTSRHILHHDVFLGHLKRRQTGLEESLDVPRGKWTFRLRDNKGNDLFSPFLVGYTDYRALLNLGHRVKRLLYLARIHVFPTGNNQVLQPIDDEEISLL